MTDDRTVSPVNDAVDVGSAGPGAGSVAATNQAPTPNQPFGWTPAPGSSQPPGWTPPSGTTPPPGWTQQSGWTQPPASDAYGYTQPGPRWGQQPFWPRPVDPATAAREALNKRLETVSWGLFIIMLGGFALVPSDRLPEGSWLVGIGIILLGLNAVRLAVGIRMSAVTTILGVLALVGGTGDMLGVDVPVGGLLLVLVGTAVIIRALDPRRA